MCRSNLRVLREAPKSSAGATGRQRMNGRPGDDPATDILHHGRQVYSPEIDDLVRQLGRLMEFRKLQEFLMSLSGLPVAEIGRRVKDRVAQLTSEGRERGWEVE